MVNRNVNTQMCMLVNDYKDEPTHNLDALAVKNPKIKKLEGTPRT